MSIALVVNCLSLKALSRCATQADVSQLNEELKEEVEEKNKIVAEFHSCIDSKEQYDQELLKFPINVHRLLSAAIECRGTYEKYLSQSAEWRGKVNSSLITTLLQQAFNVVFKYLSIYFKEAETGLFGQQTIWLAAQITDTLSQLEFCRIPGHSEYIVVVSILIPFLSSSQALGKLIFGQLLNEVRIGSNELQEWMKSQVNRSKSYFFLRILPMIVQHLGPELCEEHFLNFLQLCTQAPVTESRQISTAAHENFALVFMYAPPPIQHWFPKYLHLSLELYPQYTPYNEFAYAVLSLIKRQDIEEVLTFQCGKELAKRSFALEEDKLKVPASSMRRLCFGLMNVAPVASLHRLLDLYFGMYVTSPAELQFQMCDEIRSVLDMNQDYGRKPQLAKWYQYVASSHSKL